MTAATYTQAPQARQRMSFGDRLVRFFERVIEAQELHARRKIRQHLRALSDQHLKDLGLAPDEIRRLREGRPIASTSV